MNKIYKVVWSKVKNCYVVVSELAKSHTKSPSGKMVSRTVVAGILASIFSCGAVMPKVYAEVNPDAGANYVLYDDASAGTITLEGSITTGTVITNVAAGALSAASRDAVNGAQLYAVTQQFDDFQSALSNNNTSIAVAQTDINNIKSQNIVLRSDVNTLQTQVETGFNVNIEGAKVKTVNPDSNYVNFKMGDGINLTNDSGAVKIAVKADGVVASGNAGAMTGGLVYTEVRPANGNYVLATNTTAANLTALDTQIKANADAIAGISGQLPTYTAGDGLTLTGTEFKAKAGTNVTVDANGISVTGNGTVASGNTGLVSGGTLYNEARPANNGNYISKTNTVGANLTAIDTQLKATADAVANMEDHDTTYTAGVGLQLDGTQFKAKAGTNVTVDANGISVTGNGTVASGNTGLINGGTLYNENRPNANGNYILKTNTVGANLTAIDTQLKANTDAIANMEDHDTTYTAGVGLQLDGTQFKAKAGTNVTVDANGISVTGNGTVASGNTGLISGGTLYNEARPTANGNYISKTNTVGANLMAIDTQLKANTDAIANMEDHDTTYTAGDGLQLNGTEFKAKAGTNVTVNSNGISVTGNGTVTSGNTGLISGGTLFTENRPTANGNYVLAGNTVASNLSALDAAVKANADAIANFEGNYTAGDGLTLTGTEFKAKAGTNVTVDANGINVTGNGTVTSGNTGLISGGTVYTELRPANGNYVSQANTTAQNLSALDTQLKTTTDTVNNFSADIDNKANISLNNINNDGINVIKEYARGAINVTAHENSVDVVNVTNSVADGVKTFKIDINRDGVAASGNEGLITGDTLYNTMMDVAKADASNIGRNASGGNNAQAWGAALGATSIESGNNAMVTSDAMFDELHIAADGDYIESGKTTAENLALLDENLKQVSDSLTDMGNGKANVALDNITDAGKVVVRDLAKEAVKVVNGTHTTVTEGTQGNAKTYAVNVTANGTVASGDTNIVTGGTVYEAIQDIAGDVGTGLQGKANVTLDNITDAGHTVIKNDAKGVVNVVGGTYATVDKTDVNGVDTYTVNVATDGTVTNGDDKAVTGGTVYTAIDAAKTDILNTMNTELANKAGTNLSNITNEGVTVIKNIAKDAVDVIADESAADVVTVNKTVDASTGKAIYRVNVNDNGIVSLGDTGLLTGNTVAEYVNGNIAKVDASNVGRNRTGDADGGESNAQAWGAALGAVAIESGNFALVTSDAMYDELRVSNGEYILANKNTAENLALLDSNLKRVSDSLNNISDTVVQYDSAAKQQITLGATGSTQKVKVTNVADATLSASSSDAVTGAQLYATNQKIGDAVNGNYISTTNNVNQNLSALDTQVKANADAIGDMANVDLSNLSATGKDTIQGLVKVVNGMHTTVTEGTDGEAKTYAVNVSANGTVSENDSNLVTGGTVYNAIQDVVGGGSSLVLNKANISLDNINEAGHNVIKADAKGAVNVTGEGKVTVTKTDVSGVDTYKVGLNIDGTVASGNTGLVTGGQVSDAISELSGIIGGDLTEYAKKDASNVASDTAKWGEAIGTGAIAQNNGELVTGGTVYTALSDAQNVVDGKIADAKTDVLDSVATDLAGKANVAMDNLTDTGTAKVKEIAQDAVKLDNGSHTTVSAVTGADGNKTYKVDVDDTGTVTENNTGLVTGGTVYNAVAGANERTDTLLNDKANTSLNNITTDGVNVIKTNAQDAIQLENGLNTEVESRMDGDNRIYKVNVAGNGVIAENNTGLVSGGTVYTALADKANKDMDNLSQDGIEVIKNIALGASGSPVEVAAGDNVDVQKTTVSGKDTYTVSALTNGAVENGNTGIVNGGTVYSAIEAAKTDAQAYTDTVAATKSLDNLTEAGVQEIKTIANSAITLENGTHTTVSHRSDGNGGNIYRVDVSADGAVAENDDKLVTGGTVYSAIQTQATDITNGMNTALEGKANTSMDNITDGGKDVIRELAKGSVKVIAGTNTTVTEGTDGNFTTYAVDVAGNGTVASGDTGLISGDTLYNELRPTDGNYVSQTSTTGENLSALDTTLKDLTGRVDTLATSDSTAVHYDTDVKDVITLGGQDGTRITNLKDGELSENSTDAVTGKQLNATNTDLENQKTRITDLETNVGTLGNTVTDLGNRMTTVENTVSTHTEAINTLNGQVETLGGRVDNVETAVQQNTENISNLNTTVNNIDGRVTTLENEAGSLGQRMDNAEQEITNTKQDLSDFKDTVNTQMGQKANTDLDNITDAGKDVIRELAKGTAQEAVQVVNGTNTVVTKTVVDGNNQYSVDVVVDGVVEEGNTGIVSGDTVFKAFQIMDAKSPHYIAVNEVNRDEETYEGGATGDDSVAIGIGSKSQGTDSLAVGKGSIASGEQSVAVGAGNVVSGNHSGAFGDPNDVSGDGSYAFGNDNTVSGEGTFVLGNNVTNASGNNSVVLGAGSDGSQDNVVSVGAAGAERKIVHVADGAIEEGSTDAVNGGQLFTVDQQVQQNKADIANKADKDASNIDVDKWSEKLATGTVTEGNTGLVNGGAVYTAISNSSQIKESADGTTLEVGKNSATTAVDFTNSNGESRVIKGVATNPDDPTSVANVGYVDAIGQGILNGVNNSLQRLDTRIDKVGAGAAAMASLAPLPFDDDQKWNVSAAVGTFHGETAGAIGAFYKPAENVMLNIRGSFAGGENMGGAGVTFGLSKSASKGLSKVAMARAMNAQAVRIEEQDKKIEQLQNVVRTLLANQQNAQQ